MASSMDPSSMVRQGYDRVADRYLRMREEHGDDVRLLRDLERRLPARSRVLDVGCGAGIPIALRLSRKFQVTGVDFSPRQIALARSNVPGARFLCSDMRELHLPSASFDAICCVYAMIHVPRRSHAKILRVFARLLGPSGLLLVCMGAEDLPSQCEPDYLGAPMYWSHYDAATNLRLVRDAGFRVIWSRLVRDPTDPRASHLFVLARRGAQRPTPSRESPRRRRASTKG
jgi:SAM-dependent methyltransferase